MPLNIEWYQAPYVLLVRVEGDISPDEMSLKDGLMNRLLSEGESPVHVIYDENTAGQVPSLAAFSRLTFPKHPKHGWAVVFGFQNIALRFITSAALQLFSVRAHFVQDMDEALVFLAEMDKRLSYPTQK